MDYDGYRNLIVVLLLSSISACATSNLPPAEELASAHVAIQQAEQVGARNYAPLEIRQARKKLDQAYKLSEDKKFTEAKLLAEEAMVDAELAEAKALSEKAQKAVDELKKSIKALREEIERNQIQS